MNNSSIVTPQMSTTTQTRMNVANNKVISVFLRVTESRDVKACRLLGINDEISSYLRTKYLSNIEIITNGSPMALFKSIFSETADLRRMVDRRFDEVELAKYFPSLDEIKNESCRPMNTVEMMKANEVVIDAFAGCASSGDPLASLLLGCSQDMLIEMSITSRSTLLNTMHKYGLPLFKNRFNDLEVWRGICETGFRAPIVQRAFLQQV